MEKSNRLFPGHTLNNYSLRNKMCHSKSTSQRNEENGCTYKIQKKKYASFLTRWITKSVKEMQLITKQGTLLLIWTIALLQEVQSFNIAVDSSLLLRGDKNSYFGFSLTLHSNANGKSVIVGAPRANSSHQRGLLEPGAVFQCNVGNPSVPCRQIKLDDADNQEIRTTWKKYKEIKDGQWLGVSVNSQGESSQSPAVIACGHRWSDIRYKRRRFPNGVCYTINADLEFKSVKKLLPLVKTGRQITRDGMYYYSMGQLGMSTHFSKDGEDLLLGAVGVKDWRGGAVKYTSQKEEIIIPPDSVPFDSYTGYSLSSGKFFHDGETYTIIGSPRVDNLGKVYIYTNNFEILTEISGHQLGAYFGAVVCVADVNNDGLDDILIASPMFKQNYYDEGIVNIYINQNMGAFLKQPEALTGSKTPGSRFGTSLGCMGDINFDTYPDVAVGAPYENEGSGAIYVYMGSIEGIADRYSQRIVASQISHDLRGFGHTLSSRPMDLDGNGYADLAVGAYESDQAVVLFSRPVVHLTSSLMFYPKQMEPEKPTCSHEGELQSCVSVTVTLKYSGFNLPKQIDLLYSLEADMDKAQHGIAPRGQLRTASGRLVDTLTNTTKLALGESQQHEIIVVLKENIIDVISPMLFRLNYTVVDRALENKKILFPVLDATKPTTFTKGISFIKDCGRDNRCVTDLHLKTRLLSGPFIVVGDSSAFTIEVTVHNDGEAAYLSEVTMVFPKHLGFMKVRTSSQLGYKVSCIPENNKENTRLLLCEVGNPIPKQKTVTFQVTFDTSKVTENIKDLNITLEAVTQSTENDEAFLDNFEELIVPVQVNADIEIHALSRPQQFTLNKTMVQNSSDINQASERNGTGPAVRYLIDIYNQGPGYLPLVTVEVKIPLFTQHMKPIFHINSVEATTSRSSRTVDVQCSKKLLYDSWTLGSHPQNASNIETFDYLRIPDFSKYQQTFSTVNWNCSNAICTTFICDVNSMSVSDNVIIHINADVDIKTLALYTNAASFNITNSLLVNHTHLATMKSSSQQFSTVLSYRTASERPKLQIWPICIGVFLGLCSLVVVIIMLYKCGFFKRKELEELKRLIEENTENEAMAHMLGEQDRGIPDSELELRFALHLNNTNPLIFGNNQHLLPTGQGPFQPNRLYPSLTNHHQNEHFDTRRA